MTGMRRPYPTDVSNEIWEPIRPFIETEQTNGRSREDGILREVVNALFYMDRTGCQWNMIPHDLPPKSTVWYWFSKWPCPQARHLNTQQWLGRAAVERRATR